MDETDGAYPIRIYVRLYYPAQAGFVVEEFETSVSEESMMQFAGEILYN